MKEIGGDAYLSHFLWGVHFQVQPCMLPQEDRNDKLKFAVVDCILYHQLGGNESEQYLQHWIMLRAC